MGFIVQEADINTEQETLIKILQENRQRENYLYNNRYDWLYKKNPYGKATAWIIWDEEKNIPAGFTAVYPRKMLVKGREYICWNCGDFSIDKKYRTLGVALKLRKEAKKYVDEGIIPFLYAHPNERMVHVHLKAKHKKIGHMHRFAFPIQISNYLGNKSMSKLVGSVLDPIIKKAIKIKFSKVGDFENLSAKEMNFNNTYREICEDINRDYPVIGLRDENYLNWKFKNHPINKYKLFNYYESNQLTGYIIYSEKKNNIYISEIVSKTSEKFQQNLLSTFVNFCVTSGQDINAMSLVVQEYHPLIPVLKNIGFRFRSDATSDVIAYCANSGLKNLVEDGRNWFMTVGDRDA